MPRAALQPLEQRFGLRLVQGSVLSASNALAAAVVNHNAVACTCQPQEAGELLWAVCSCWLAGWPAKLVASCGLAYTWKGEWRKLVLLLPPVSIGVQPCCSLKQAYTLTHAVPPTVRPTCLQAPLSPACSRRSGQWRARSCCSTPAPPAVLPGCWRVPPLGRGRQRWPAGRRQRASPPSSCAGAATERRVRQSSRHSRCSGGSGRGRGRGPMLSPPQVHSGPGQAAVAAQRGLPQGGMRRSPGPPRPGRRCTRSTAGSRGCRRSSGSRPGAGQGPRQACSLRHQSSRGHRLRSSIRGGISLAPVAPSAWVFLAACMACFGPPALASAHPASSFTLSLLFFHTCCCAITLACDAARTTTNTTCRMMGDWT